VTELEVSGTALLEHAPAALPDLFAGAPVLLSLQLRPEGGRLVVRGRRASGVWEQRLEVPAVEAGRGEAAVAALFGREKVDDLEARAAAGERKGIDAEIEQLGLAFQIATRLTSWVAISEQPCVDPGAPMLRERMPHALADGISAEGLGLREGGTVVCCAARAPSRIELASEVSPSMPIAEMDSVSFCMTPEPERPRDPQARMADFDSVPASRQLFFDEMDARRTARALLARVVLRAGRKLVLEIELPEPMEWAPDGRVALLLGSGEAVAAAVDAAHSTQPARIAAGRTVRLVLEAAEEIGDRALRAVIARFGGRPVAIQVAP
jgi:Ca-activated chloride channel family protein